MHAPERVPPFRAHPGRGGARDVTAAAARNLTTTRGAGRLTLGRGPLAAAQPPFPRGRSAQRGPAPFCRCRWLRPWPSPWPWPRATACTLMCSAAKCFSWCPRVFVCVCVSSSSALSFTTCTQVMRSISQQGITTPVSWYELPAPHPSSSLVRTVRVTTACERAGVKWPACPASPSALLITGS